MFDFATIRKGIYDWITSVTGEKVVKADQNAPKRDNPEFTYKINSILRIGDDYLSAPDATGKATLYGNRDFTCQVLGFGDGIYNKTEILRSSLSKPDILAALNAKKIVVVDDNGAEDISGLDGTEFEERSTIDFFMRSEMVEEGVDVGLIKIVNGEATIKQPGKADIKETLAVDST